MGVTRDMETLPVISLNLNSSQKTLINNILETLAVMQITHGDSDKEWFVVTWGRNKPTDNPYFLCTGRRRSR